MKCDDCGRMITVNARHFVETENLDTMVYCLCCAENYLEEENE